ncbi:Reverse transcriptase (RNA-dependent DNA polymerase) [Popillia japonica]|uniref:Reverse transcriptase (RNA-dependent DNA polymerase) n=1 Tax=Popillia japonica TaxID=7064 RepID=A0AAW1JI48_POPJA
MSFLGGTDEDGDKTLINANDLDQNDYVDDGLVAASDGKEIEEVISYLQHHFEVKALDAKCFLGLQIEQSCDGSISICQEAYAKKVLKRFNMSECATVSTPADCNQNLGDYASDGQDTRRGSICRNAQQCPHQRTAIRILGIMPVMVKIQVSRIVKPLEP